VTLHIVWDLEPGGNAEHVLDHGLDIEEVEHVLREPTVHAVSRSTGRPLVLGYTPAGEYIVVVYELLDEDTVYPVTAFPVGS
jgi:uncharacterized DUF497 family protein